MDSNKQNSSPEMQSQNLGMDLQGYVRLRTLIDSLECGAIRYMLEQSEGRGGRFDELSARLMPLIDWVWKKDKQKPPYPDVGGGGDVVIDCPQGYIDCNGVCVPYPCPD